MPIDLFLPLTDNIFNLSLHLVMTSRKLRQSQLIILSLVKFIHYFLSQFLTSSLQLFSQDVHLKSMVFVTICHLASQTFQIVFVQLTNFDFVQLDLSLVMFHDVLDFVLEFIVVFFYHLKTLFFVYL